MEFYKSYGGNSHFEGYNIIEIGPSTWSFEMIGIGDLFTGSFKEVVMYAVLQHDFDINEIDIAIQTMLDGNNNAMHFGAWKTFIYSHNVEIVPERMAV